MIYFIYLMIDQLKKYSFYQIIFFNDDFSKSNSMYVYCLPTVYNAGPAVKQYQFKVSFLLGYEPLPWLWFQADVLGHTGVCGRATSDAEFRQQLTGLMLHSEDAGATTRSLSEPLIHMSDK